MCAFFWYCRFLTCTSGPASFDLNLVLKQSISATEWNHTSSSQIQLVQFVQDGRCHNVAQQTQYAHQQHDQAWCTQTLLEKERIGLWLFTQQACTLWKRSCDTDRHFKADGVTRYKQTRSEGCEVLRAANRSARVGLCQGHHAVCTPLLFVLAEVLTQRGEHPDLQMNAKRLSVRTAGRAHVDEVVQSGVIGSEQRRTEMSQWLGHDIYNSELF